MKPLIRLIAVFAACLSMVACAYVGLSPDYPSTKVRYKMTVAVETPEGIKTGSAVREISMVSRPMLLGESNDTHVKLEKGEAVVVDLGQRGVLFAALEQGIWPVFQAFPSQCPEGDVSRCGVRHYASLGKDAEAVLLGAPPLLKFRNLNDPMSVVPARDKHVCPLTEMSCVPSVILLESAFGKGVSLRGITVKITDEKITNEVEKWLPWLEDLKGGYLNGGFTSRGAPLGLHGGDFRVDRQ